MVVVMEAGAVAVAMAGPVAVVAMLAVVARDNLPANHLPHP